MLCHATDDKPRAMSSLLEYCRGAKEEDEVKEEEDKVKTKGETQVIFGNENQIVMHHFPRELARLNYLRGLIILSHGQSRMSTEERHAPKGQEEPSPGQSECNERHPG